MRILQIASGDFFSTYGGGQVYVKNIVDEMIRQHCDVVVISFVQTDGNIRKKNYKGIALYEVDNTVNLKTLIADITPDVIHAHSHKAQIVRIGNMLKIPVIVTSHHGGIVCPAGTLMDCHDKICRNAVSHKKCLRCVLRNTRFASCFYPIVRLLPQNAYIKLGKWLKHKPFILLLTPVGCAAHSIANKQQEWHDIAEGCSRMIAPCNEIASAMERNGLDKDKITVLPHGIPMPKDVPAYPEINNGNIKFFYTGRICYVKGLHILLEAFHRLSAANVELHLIGGSGNKSESRYEAQLKRRYKHDKRIVWRGKVDPSEIFETIRDLHVSSSSSSYLEVFGLNIAEALAMGKPVLSTLNGGAEMQIEDGVNGWLVPQNDVEAMRWKMQEIVDNFHTYDTRKSAIGVIPICKHCENLLDIYMMEVNNNEKSVD